MRKYYESEHGVLYCGNAEELDLPNNVADTIITDPPYGVSYNSGRRQASFENIEGDDSLAIGKSVLEKMIRGPLKRYRHAYAFGSPNFVHHEGLTREPVELIWDKGSMSMGDLKLPYGKSHEHIYMTVAVRSKSNIEKGEGRLAARMRQGSVLRVPRVNAAAVTKHPTQKPTLLLRMLIESSTVIGETVLDPFVGSGSTAVAAILSGRKYISCEMSEEYCEIAKQRIQAAEKAIKSISKM